MSDNHRIKINKIRCLKCGQELESTHRHDFRMCNCENCAVDGGRDYLKRSLDPDGPGFEELSEYE